MNTDQKLALLDRIQAIFDSYLEGNIAEDEMNAAVAKELFDAKAKENS